MAVQLDQRGVGQAQRLVNPLFLSPLPNTYGQPFPGLKGQPAVEGKGGMECWGWVGRVSGRAHSWPQRDPDVFGDGKQCTGCEEGGGGKGR